MHITKPHITNNNKQQTYLLLTYILVFFVILATLHLLPKPGGYIWQAEIINPISAILFTLLVYLTGYIARTTQSIIGILCTTIFILLFCPETPLFFTRDENAVIQLSSSCIVPFFISQYNLIANKNFKMGYFVMLVMGIFCSYTHDSISIPLCLAFLTLGFQQRGRLFRLACWPMIIGFAIGTTLCIVQTTHIYPSFRSNILAFSAHTVQGIAMLWQTKVFLVAILVDIYFLYTKKRRKKFWQLIQQHKLLSHCLMYSLCAVPFAPFGIDKTISGVCFFCMFWTLILFSQAISNNKKTTCTAPTDNHPATSPT